MDGLQAVAGRIAGIEARFTTRVDRQTAVAPPQTTDFDPFGDAYQQAVEAAVGGAGRTAGTTADPMTQFSSAPLTASPALIGYSPVSGTFAPTPAATTAVTTATDAQTIAAISGLAGPPGARPIGGYGSMPIPETLRSTGNGRLATEQLAPIRQGAHRLFAPAAAAWDNLVTVAARDGINLRITDSYRSYDEQVDLARRKGLYADGGLAATPGTSNHGWGLAVDVDVDSPATQEWLRINAPRFGWVEAVPREPWHWEFRPNQV